MPIKLKSTFFLIKKVLQLEFMYKISFQVYRPTYMYFISFKYG